MSGAPPELRRGRPLNRRSAGRLGEDLALEYLQRLGYSLVERNYRTRYGEIDLILRHRENTRDSARESARENARENGTLVFVEVKLRKSTAFGHPLEAVTPRKQAKLRSLARLYLQERRLQPRALRFDVVGIHLQGNTPHVVHVENAF